MTLTSRRRAVLAAIVRHSQSQGYAPSMRDVGEAVGLASTNTVSYHVCALRAEGLLRPNSPDQPRTLALAEGVAISRNGLVARAVAVSHCPLCLISLPEDHDCDQSRSEECSNA